MAGCAQMETDMPLLTALEGGLLGLPHQGQDQLETWAREVVSHLKRTGAYETLGPEAMLATAARALREIMCSGSWQFLLADALNHPSVSARTLSIMLQGKEQARRPAAGH